MPQETCVWFISSTEAILWWIYLKNGNYLPTKETRVKRRHIEQFAREVLKNPFLALAALFSKHHEGGDTDLVGAEPPLRIQDNKRVEAMKTISWRPAAFIPKRGTRGNGPNKAPKAE